MATTDSDPAHALPLASLSLDEAANNNPRAGTLESSASADAPSDLSGPSASPPVLPVEIIERCADEAVAVTDDWGARDAMVSTACAVSLVCKGLRRVGQAALWSSITIGHGRDLAPSPARKVEGAKNSPHLAALVRRLDWQRGEDDDDDWARREREEQEEEDWIRVLEACTRCASVSIWARNGRELRSAVRMVAVSPVAEGLRSLVLQGYNPSPAEQHDLASLLRYLPSLRRLFTWAVSHQAPSPTPLPLANPLLRVHDLTVLHPGALAVPPPVPPPFLRQLDTTFLTSAMLSASVERTTLLSWLSAHAFPNLTSLHLWSSPDSAPSLFLPLLPSPLSGFTALKRLHLLSSDHQPIPCQSSGDIAALSSFLRRLPPNLAVLSATYLVPSPCSTVKNDLDSLSRSPLRSFGLRNEEGKVVRFERKAGEKEWTTR